jgi:hypothetical protein
VQPLLVLTAVNHAFSALNNLLQFPAPWKPEFLNSGFAETSQYSGNWQCVVPVKAIRLTETSEITRPTTGRNIPEESNRQVCTTTRNKSRRNLQSLRTQTTAARFEHRPPVPASPRPNHSTPSLNFNVHISPLTSDQFNS